MIYIGHLRGLQLYGVCVRANRMRQEFLDARYRLAAEPTRNYTQSFRTRLRGNIRHGRCKVLGARILHRDLQRGSERPVEHGHQAETRVEGEPGEGCLCTRYTRVVKYNIYNIFPMHLYDYIHFHL